MEQLRVRTPEPTENVRQVQAIRKKEFVGKIRIGRGLALWQCELATGLVTKVSLDLEVVVVRNGKPVKVREVTAQAGFIYDRALNATNAVRKFENRLFSKVNGPR